MKEASVSSVLIAVVLLIVVVIAQAQQAQNTPRVGVLLALCHSAISDRIQAFREGLRELGYVEGKSIVVEYRYADGKFERLPDLATELAQLKVDVIVTGGTDGNPPS